MRIDKATSRNHVQNGRWNCTSHQKKYMGYDKCILALLSFIAKTFEVLIKNDLNLCYMIFQKVSAKLNIEHPNSKTVECENHQRNLL
jgi:hypothetical protein